MSLHKTKPKLKRYKKAGLLNKKELNLQKINFFLPEYTYLNLYLKKLEHTFSNSLNNRRKIKLLSGFNQIYKLNNFVEKIEKKTRNKWRLSKTSSLVALIERRLDIVLFRIGFSSTLSQARQLISHRKVLVNNTIVTSPFFILKKGDIISFSPCSKKTLITNIKHTVNRRKSFLAMFKHLEINLSILKVVFLLESSRSSGYLNSYTSKQDWNLLFSK
jgi:ribosomal protein S4